MQRGQTGGWLTIGGLGGGLLILLFNLADMMKGNAIFQPDPAPLVALGVGACLAYGAVVLGPIGRALGKRLLADVEPADGALADIRGMFDTVQQQLAETNDRLEFTERLLAQSRTPDQLPK
jgi:hypothetical protein